MWPWVPPWAYLPALLAPPCGPVRVSLAPPAAAFGPLAPWAPVWAVMVDPGRTPRLAAGLSLGPFALALHLAGSGR